MRKAEIGRIWSLVDSRQSFANRCWLTTNENDHRRFKNMRVIAGHYRRRTLRSLPGLEIRPTADRLRETLFNVLCAGNPEALAESTWIDLYAGTGAVGIEALSRGARMVHFVESSKAAAEVIAANLKALGIAGSVQIVRLDAAKALRQLEAPGTVVD